MILYYYEIICCVTICMPDFIDRGTYTIIINEKKCGGVQQKFMLLINISNMYL